MNKSCIYMYTLQHLCSQRRAGPEVQIYMKTLNDSIGHALQMIVLLCPLKEMNKSPVTQNTYVFYTFSYTHINMIFCMGYFHARETYL